MRPDKIIVPIVIGVGVIIGLFFFIWNFRGATAEMRGKIEAKETIQSAEYRIFSYDHFYDMYANVQAYQDQIENQQDMLETITDEEEATRYRRNINGLKNRRDAAIREYNADAAKEGTRGQFRADDLPYKISKEDFK